jgi:mRNA interferase MazF
MSGITRGDVFYIDKYSVTGSEQHSGRPAVVVSNDMCNECSSVVEVVYMTTQPKSSMPTHVTIKSLSQRSTALCEQITSVAKERIGSWCARVTDDEMRQIEDAMLISLGLDYIYDGVAHPQPAEVAKPAVEMPNVAVLTAERDLYKTLYEEMLNRMLPAKKVRGVGGVT